ncbi:MAG: response regulator [Ignavibacteriales bacterium]|nr:response regulator [Ignavibacteriales bacterium]
MSSEATADRKGISFQYLPIFLFMLFIGVWGWTLYDLFGTRTSNEQHRLSLTAENLGRSLEKDLLNHEQEAITLAEAAVTIPDAEFSDLCSTYVRSHEEVVAVYVKNASLKPVKRIRQSGVQNVELEFPSIRDSNYYVSIMQPVYYTAVWRENKEKYVAVERPIINNGTFYGVAGIVISFNKLLSTSIRSIAMTEYDAALLSPETSDVLASTSAISFRSPIRSGYALNEVGIDLQLEMVDAAFSYWDVPTVLSIIAGIIIACILFVWMYLSVNNIKLLRSAERTLRESEERFRILWDHSADGMRLTDRYGRIVMVNQAYCDLVRVSPQKLTEEYRSGNVDDVRYTADSTYRHMFDAGIVKLPISQTIRRPNGDEIPVEIINSFIHPAEGEKMMLSIFRDISARKKLEENLQQVQRMDALGRFAVEIGNNFNNILGIILNAAESLKTKLMHRTDVVDYISMIISHARRGGDAAGNLLVFARTEQNEVREVSVPKSLEHANKILQHSLPPTVSLSLSLGDNNAVVLGDIHELHQAVVNLGLAANERMPSGGKITIDSHVIGSEDVRLMYPNARDGQYVAVTVNDNGTALNEVQKRTIFEPYFNTQVQQSGTGLRLAVTYSIVKRHNGFARVESDPEHGTTFYLYFPVVRHEDIPFELAEPEPPKQGKGLVLLVDDEEAYRILYEQEFLSHGYSVLTAQDGEEALRTYEHYRNEISLVVTDISMPNMNGEELFQHLVEMNPSVKVIFATGNIDAKSRAEILNLGVKGIVEKPFTFAQLMSLVQQVLSA